MLKHYMATMADALQDEGHAAGTVRQPSGIEGKTFQLTRRWDYRRLDRPAASALVDVEELNTLGLDGWELAGIVTDATGAHYFLKRQRGG